MSTSQILCPKCGEPIDVDKIVKHDIERQLRDELEQKFALDAEALASQHKNDMRKLKELEIAHLELARVHREQAEEMELDIRKRVLLEQHQVEERIKRQEQERYALERKQDLERVERERKSEAERLESERKAENERIESERKAEKERIDRDRRIEMERFERERKADAEKHELEKREMQKRHDDNMKLVEEMRRKAEQGSQQMQGEILELAIEEFLQQAFPYDTIEPVRKGSKGADCLQVVNDAGRRKGSIYYESKRTKIFSDEWIAKLKQDMRERGADVGVLVTDVMPKYMERFGNVQGIWICRFDEFKALCHVLRTMVLEVANATQSHENKGEKMAMLYGYLTGNEFRMQVEAIVDAFTTMQIDLARERMQAEKNWKQREKQIEKVMLNTVHMHASIKGIAGSEILEVRSLESADGSETSDEMTREHSALRP